MYYNITAYTELLSLSLSLSLCSSAYLFVSSTLPSAPRKSAGYVTMKAVSRHH